MIPLTWFIIKIKEHYFVPCSLTRKSEHMTCLWPAASLAINCSLETLSVLLVCSRHEANGQWGELVVLQGDTVRQKVWRVNCQSNKTTPWDRRSQRWPASFAGWGHEVNGLEGELPILQGDAVRQKVLRVSSDLSSTFSPSGSPAGRDCKISTNKLLST